MKKKTKTKSRSSPHVSTIPDVTRVHDLGEQSWDWSQIYLSRLRYVLPLILIALLPLDKRPLAITGPWNTVATGPHDFLFFFFYQKDVTQVKPRVIGHWRTSTRDLTTSRQVCTIDSGRWLWISIVNQCGVKCRGNFETLELSSKISPVSSKET